MCNYVWAAPKSYYEVWLQELFQEYFHNTFAYVYIYNNLI
jgi:hypothetical protein